MTVKELYEWALKEGAVDYEISVQYQDGGGAYLGDTFIDGTICVPTVREWCGKLYVNIE